MPRERSDQSLSKSKRKMLHDVDSFGWQVIKVCGEFPEWAYSVGMFKNFRHPEIIIFGLPPNLMHSIINAIGEGIRKHGKLSLNQRCDAYLEGFDVAFRTVNSNWCSELMGQASWFYEDTPYSAVQCCWPDMENHLPWDSGYNQQLHDRQPLLFEATVEDAHLSAILDESNDSDAE